MSPQKKGGKSQTDCLLRIGRSRSDVLHEFRWVDIWQGALDGVWPLTYSPSPVTPTLQPLPLQPLTQPADLQPADLQPADLQPPDVQPPDLQPPDLQPLPYST